MDWLENNFPSNQTATLLHAGETSRNGSVRASRAHLEDAHFHLCASARLGDAVGGQVIEVLAGLPLLPHLDGANKDFNGESLHSTRA